MLRYTHLEPPERRQPQVAEDYAKCFVSRLGKLAPLLEAQDFLCAGCFTAADISVGYALMLAQHIGLNERFAPSIGRYWERLQVREGFVRALCVQEEAAVK